MKELSEGVKGYGKSKGYDVIVQDPNLDPQKQVTDLHQRHRVRHGRRRLGIIDRAARRIGARGARPRSTRRSRCSSTASPRTTASTACSPASPSTPSTTTPRARPWARSSATASTRSSAARPRSSTARPQPGTAGKEEHEKAVKAALAKATAPDAKIVQHHRSSATGPRPRPTSAAPCRATPASTRSCGQNDEGALGALGAFDAAGKELPCLTETGGNDEVLQAVKDGKIYASVALQFAADMTQSFDTLAKMMADPTQDGPSSSPCRRRSSRRRRADHPEADHDMTAQRGQPTRRPPADGSHRRRRRRSRPVEDMPRSVSVLVFLRDRGIFVLWGLLIVVFALLVLARTSSRSTTRCSIANAGGPHRDLRRRRRRSAS